MIGRRRRVPRGDEPVRGNPRPETVTPPRREREPGAAAGGSVPAPGGLTMDRGIAPCTGAARAGAVRTAGCAPGVVRAPGGAPGGAPGVRLYTGVCTGDSVRAPGGLRIGGPSVHWGTFRYRRLHQGVGRCTEGSICTPGLSAHRGLHRGEAFGARGWPGPVVPGGRSAHSGGNGDTRWYPRAAGPAAGGAGLRCGAGAGGGCRLPGNVGPLTRPTHGAAPPRAYTGVSHVVSPSRSPLRGLRVPLQHGRTGACPRDRWGFGARRLPVPACPESPRRHLPAGAALTPCACPHCPRPPKDLCVPPVPHRRPRSRTAHRPSSRRRERQRGALCPPSRSPFRTALWEV